MEEFDALVSKITSPVTDQAARSLSEHRLLEILDNNSGNWRSYLQFLFHANDTACFFIAIGLQRLIWKHWRNFSTDDQTLLTQSIVQAMTMRPNMPHFVKSKLEQLVAAICASSCSLQPALSQLVEADNPGAINGLSMIRTVVEFVLSEDSKITQDQKETLSAATIEILVPLTNLAASSCSLALKNTADSYNSKMLATSIELLKILIMKLPIGAHITNEVIVLLFNVAEEGSCVTSFEVLSEIMLKKYLPQTMQRVDLVARTVMLMKHYRVEGRFKEDSTGLLPLLEYVTVFSESHLEHCINLATGAQGTGGQMQLLSRTVQEFFDELVTVTTATTDPSVLYRVVSVWCRIIHVEAVRDMLVLQPAIGLPIVSHLLQACLTQTNTDLHECLDELIEDLRIEPLVDPNIKEILGHLSLVPAGSTGSSSGSSSSRDLASIDLESSYVGTTLLQDVNTLLSELVSNHEIATWLRTTTGQLLQQNISMAMAGETDRSKRSAAAMDLCFLIRILPMVTTNLPELVSQLVGLISGLVEHRMHTYGPELVALQVITCQITGMVVQTIIAGSSSPQLDQVQVQGVFQLLVKAVLSVCDNAISPSPFPIIVSSCVLLYQVVIAFGDALSEISSASNPNRINVTVTTTDTFEAVQKVLDSPMAANLPSEVYVLLLCSSDQISWYLEPTSVAGALLQQFTSQCASFESNLAAIEKGLIGQGYMQIDASLVSSFIRVCGAMGALAKAHSLAKAQKRQSLISIFAPLVNQQYLEKMSSVLFRCLLNTYTIHLGGNSSNNITGSLSSTVYAVRLVASLSSALLQSLGKKTFGKASSEVLSISVDFTEKLAELFAQSPAADNQVLMLFESSGLALTKQVLELAQVLAICTPASSPTASQQAKVTHRLLVLVASGLNREQACAELLQPTLKTGIVAIGCYWQKSQSRVSGGLGLPMPPSSSDSSAGLNVQPIVLLLTQLCAGSLGPTVPPQDTLTALEGMQSLSEQHNIFSINWFQTMCWGQLLTPCLRAVLLRYHVIHRDTIEQLLLSLTTVGALAYCRGDKNSRDDFSIADDVYIAKCCEFWTNIGRECLTIASECNVGDAANVILGATFNVYFAPGVSRSTAVSFDMKIFLEKILHPISVEITRATVT